MRSIIGVSAVEKVRAPSFVQSTSTIRGPGRINRHISSLNSLGRYEKRGNSVGVGDLKHEIVKEWIPEMARETAKS